MNRIDKKFAQLKKQKKKALIVYLTAGDPSLKKNEELIYALEKDGVDLIELGVPFSDPAADGAVIQEASQRALLKKTNLKKILALVSKIRKKSQIPILLMSYLNPVLQFGLARFAKEAKKCGVDGLIMPDLPPDEGKEISKLMKRQQIDLVYLLAPTSGPKRMKLVTRSSRGFVYYVSLTGVTGARRSLPSTIGENIKLAKKMTSLPVCVGFGISTPEQAKTVSKVSDGVIVGSAIVRALAKNSRVGATLFSHKYVRPFARALGKES